MRFVFLLNERTASTSVALVDLNLQFCFLHLTSSPLVSSPLAPPLTPGSAHTTHGCTAFMHFANSLNRFFNRFDTQDYIASCEGAGRTPAPTLHSGGCTATAGQVQNWQGPGAGWHPGKGAKALCHGALPSLPLRLVGFIQNS